MKYYFKPDLYVVIATVFGPCLVFYVWVAANTISTFSFWLAVAVSLIFLWFIVKAPIYTYIDDEVIRVKQLIGSTTFIRQEVSVRSLTDRETESIPRFFGSCGLGGYIGLSRNPFLGSYYVLALTRKDMALVTRDDGKIFVINYPPQVKM